MIGPVLPPADATRYDLQTIQVGCDPDGGLVVLRFNASEGPFYLTLKPGVAVEMADKLKDMAAAITTVRMG